jgi:hypothetical protein
LLLTFCVLFTAEPATVEGGSSAALIPAVGVPLQVWEGFLPPKIQFNHGDFFQKGSVETRKVVLCPHF